VDFIFFVIYVCLGIYIWSRWQMPRGVSKLLSERRYSAHAFWGEEIPVDITVENPGLLPISWLRVEENVAVELRKGERVNNVVSLPGRDKITLSYEVSARRRGYYQLGPLRLVSGDLFGMLPAITARLPAEYLTVYPRITPLTRLGLPSRLPFGTVASKQRLFADPARPMGVRDYRSGDSLRQINWKASAHTRQLMVKTFQPAISLATAVLLNLNLEEYDRAHWREWGEWGIELAASLCAHLIEQRQTVGLMTNGLDPLAMIGLEATFDERDGRLQLPPTDELREAPAKFLPADISPRNGRPHLMKILERLARVEIVESVDFVDWLPRPCLNLSWGTTILVITPRSTERLQNGLHRLVRSGFNPVLLATAPAPDFGRVRERARRLGFMAYQVMDQRDLSAWRQDV